jgi:outer membrane protein assembly factor BamB
VDSNDEIVFAGWTQGDFAETNAGSDDAFVMKIAGSDGSEIWRKQFGTVSSDRAHAVAVDSGDNALIAGYVGAEFGCAGAPAAAFVTKLDSDGGEVWFHRLGVPGQRANSVATDANDNVYVLAGHFVRKLTPNGTVVWTHFVVPPGERSVVQTVFPTLDGGAVVGGYFGPLNETDAFATRLAP